MKIYLSLQKLFVCGFTAGTMLMYSSIAAEEETSKALDTDNVEEVTVIGEQFEIDTAVAFERLTESNGRGAKLYKQGKYKEALPYLLVGAKTGFKMSQARVGAIYLGGLGGVQKDFRKGIGWLGVASEPITSPEIRQIWKRVMKSVPSSNKDQVAAIVADYVSLYGSGATGTECEMTANTKSLIARLECTLDDEFYRFASDDVKAVVGCFSGVTHLCEVVGLNHLAIAQSAIGQGPF